MDTIFVLTPCHTPQHWYLLEKGFYTFLVTMFFHLVSRLCGCCQAMPCEPLTLVATGVCSPGSLKTVTIMENRLPASGHSTNNRLKHTPALCKRGLFACPCASAWEPGFRSVTHLEATYSWELKMKGDFGTCWVVQWLKTLHFQCRGHGFDPWPGN